MIATYLLALVALSAALVALGAASRIVARAEERRSFFARLR